MSQKELPKHYNPAEAESKWYTYWEENGFFASQPDDRPAYTIVIPPPNVTGRLHMGHMLNNTLQDVLIRKARMSGLNACWVPGTDHASIATEAKVVAKLKEQGIEKRDLSREEFLKHAWAWTEEHGGVILQQLRKLGASCDWERSKFTLDEDLSQSVIQVFVRLYEQGLIYREYKMVNWDPEAQTTVSDEEVFYEEQNGKLYTLKYKIVDSDAYLEVATTRPETIFGDTAVCMNPDDERYQHLKGKKVVVPLVEREVPLIFDTYVDPEFGTGCLKVTPANDPNDKAIGERHSLAVIEIFNDDASLNNQGLHYEGKDRFVVRKEIAQELEARGELIKSEDYINKVGKSERTKAVIEPKLSLQWFLKMEDIAKRALASVAESKVNFFPKHYVNTYNHWLENIRDWNISRQLWWGHRIPAYYYGPGTNDFVVAENADLALEKAKSITQNPQLTASNLRQEEDALDTWFSSWLWPISVFDGIRHPDNAEINYYYPTSDLVTGPDIIFFWVARMIMAGNTFMDKEPFRNVYFTGIVRDKQGRKMSKQLGNSPDPIELIEKYGADGVRVGVLLSSSAGTDLMFDEDLCLQGRNFANKIWNAFRLTQMWDVKDATPPLHAQQAVQWMQDKIRLVALETEADYSKYRISDVIKKLYKLIWNDFCSTYLELIKPDFGQPIDAQTLAATNDIWEDLLHRLHPFMPFITEEIWQSIAERTTEDALIASQLKPGLSVQNPQMQLDFDLALELVSAVRNLRSEKQISPKETLNLYGVEKMPLPEVVTKLANVEFHPEKGNDSMTSLRFATQELHVALDNLIDTDAEKKKLQEELTYTQGFLKSVQKKLQNERFVASAPEKVVALERKKESDALEKIQMLESALGKF